MSVAAREDDVRPWSSARRAATLGSVIEDDNGLEVLGEDECHVLLGRTGLGRLALTRQALPVIVPVLYATFHGLIAIDAA